VDNGPNFASIILPIMGDNKYELWEKNSLGKWFDTDSILPGGNEFLFGGAGVSDFRILGIEGIDPNTPDAFVTGLTFTGVGDVEMRQIPIYNTGTVPEPTTLLLFGTGLAGLAGLRLRRKK
jgi:hypothetical protein